MFTIFVHNFCKQILLIIFITAFFPNQNFCSQFLLSTFVHNLYQLLLTISVHNSYLQLNYCSHILFTTHVHNSFSKLKFWSQLFSQLMFTTLVHNFFVQLWLEACVNNFFHNFFNNYLFTTLVHRFTFITLISQLFVPSFCLQLSLTTLFTTLVYLIHQPTHKQNFLFKLRWINFTA